MANINRIIYLIDEYLESNRLNHVGPSEVAAYLAKTGLCLPTEEKLYANTCEMAKFLMQSNPAVKNNHGISDIQIVKKHRFPPRHIRQRQKSS